MQESYVHARNIHDSLHARPMTWHAWSSDCEHSPMVHDQSLTKRVISRLCHQEVVTMYGAISALEVEHNRSACMWSNALPR
jgi:hypothetical protein